MSILSDQSKQRQINSDPLSEPIQANIKTFTDRRHHVTIDDFSEDLELMGRQHLLVNGLKCQNGCEEYATEKVHEYLDSGKEIDKLVCFHCAVADL